MHLCSLVGGVPWSPRRRVISLAHLTDRERPVLWHRSSCLACQTPTVPARWPRSARSCGLGGMVTVDVGPVSVEEVVAVARDGAPVELGGGRTRGDRPGPRGGRGAGGRADARRTASRPASARWPPGTSRPSCAPSCSARWSARTRPAPAPRSSARWCAALMLLRLSTLATGHTGVRRETAQLLAGLLSHGHHAGRARVRLAGLLRRPRAALALRAGADGRGRGARRRRASCVPAAEALAAAGLAPVELAAKEGLALINGTDGMLGMLVLAIDRPAPCCCARRTSPPRCPSRRSSAPTGSSPPSSRRSARTPARRSRPPTWSRCSPTPASSPRTAGRTATASRTPTRCAAPRRCTAPPATPSSTPRAVAGARARRRGRQPGGPAADRVGVQRQLPRRPGRLRARLPGDRRRRRGLDQRAAHRPVPRQGPQPRAAAVPRRRPRRRQRPHDRPVHPGRDRLRAEAARRPGLGRLDPLQRDAGGPRLDGLVGRAQAAPVGRRPDPGGRRSRCSPPPARSTCARRCEPVARHRRRGRAAPRHRRSRAPAPTATSRPRSRPPSSWSPRVPS